jgi:hypothetical protein
VSGQDPVAWLRRTVEGDRERWQGVLAGFQEAPQRIAAVFGSEIAGKAAFAGEQVTRCEAELAILGEHLILRRGEMPEGYEEFSVVRIGGADKDSGCVTCHYYGQGGVKGYGICRTVKFLASGYQHRPGYREEDWKPGVTPWKAPSGSQG